MLGKGELWEGFLGKYFHACWEQGWNLSLSSPEPQFHDHCSPFNFEELRMFYIGSLYADKVQFTLLSFQSCKTCTQ